MADNEKLISEGKPSQVTNLFFSRIFVIPVLRVMTTQYRVTDERVTRRHGILSKRTDNLELYRAFRTSLWRSRCCSESSASSMSYCGARTRRIPNSSWRLCRNFRH